MTERLHNLIDSGAGQQVVNERIAGLMDGVVKDLARIGSDHEKRLRFLERSLNWGLGFIGAISTLLYLISVLKK